MPGSTCRFFSAPREPNIARLVSRECQSSGQKRGALRGESDFRCAALRSALVQRAERIRFRDQKITAPHTDGVKGGCSPQNIASNVASDRGASFARSQDFPVTL